MGPGCHLYVPVDCYFSQVRKLFAHKLLDRNVLSSSWVYILLVLFLWRTLIPSSVLTVVLEEQNFKAEFSELLRGVWNWLANLTRFKVGQDAISSNDKNIDRPG